MIRKELFEHAARGTKSTVFMAFGMQFNPEVPSQAVDDLVDYFCAHFLCSLIGFMRNQTFPSRAESRPSSMISGRVRESGAKPVL